MIYRHAKLFEPIDMIRKCIFNGKLGQTINIKRLQTNQFQNQIYLFNVLGDAWSHERTKWDTNTIFKWNADLS